MTTNVTALAERPTEAMSVPVVTADQLELIKKTVAQGATADELKLYLYDCARQGVHPLDRLIHFTKRAGKYTPITSIDFMRIRAAETGEYAGNDDATFVQAYVHGGDAAYPSAATVAVWRLVQGTRCSFTATARWSEYKPDANDFMWKKMPHTMLAKCAEALALRKGFPKQLAGLYAREEMDQAGPSNGGSTHQPVIVEAEIGPTDTLPEPPEGAVFLRKSEQRETSKGKPYWLLLTQQGEELVAWDSPVGSAAEQAVRNKEPVVLTTKGVWDNKSVVKGLRVIAKTAPAVLTHGELAASDIAF